MAQIDTRHAEKSKYFELLVAQHSPSNIDLQIAQATAAMEQEDIEDVERKFEKWLSKQTNNTNKGE